MAPKALAFLTEAGLNNPVEPLIKKVAAPGREFVRDKDGWDEHQLNVCHDYAIIPIVPHGCCPMVQQIRLTSCLGLELSNELIHLGAYRAYAERADSLVNDYHTPISQEPYYLIGVRQHNDFASLGQYQKRFQNSYCHGLTADEVFHLRLQNEGRCADKSTVALGSSIDMKPFVPASDIIAGSDGCDYPVLGKGGAVVIEYKGWTSLPWQPEAFYLPTCMARVN